MLEILTSDALPARHGFFTRKGGASSGIFAGLNCGTGSSDIAEIVVINRGRADGLTMDTRLLVKRGGVLLGKLNIAMIEANQTIADIDLKTIAPGVQVMPGDQVVFENSVQ